MICSTEKREEIYHEFYPKVRAYVFSHLNDKSEVEDIVSAVFVKIYASLDSYDEDKASLSTWIYTITKNTVINHIKKLRFTLVSLSELTERRAEKAAAESDEMLERLDEALSTLSGTQHDIVILRYYFGFSHQEISQKLKMSYVNVRKQCSLAIAELRRRLG